MKKPEKIVSAFALLLFAGMLAYGYWRKRRSDESPVYVKAKVYAIQDTENGQLYQFAYFYNAVKYKAGLKALTLPMKDSVILLKISKLNPTLWEVVDGIP